MGEAKRRKKRIELDRQIRDLKSNDALIQKVFENTGETVTVAMIGAALILPTIAAIPNKELMKPQHRIMRNTFSVFDRIRTGELKGYCTLCHKPKTVQQISCFAVIQRANAGITSSENPAVILPICHQCDSISTEETKRRVLEYFPLHALAATGGIA